MASAGDASHSDSLEWVQFFDMGGLHFWNRRTRETARQPPAGVNVVLVGTMDEEEGLLLLAQEQTCQYICPSSSSWVTGYGVRGLASPHSFLGATALAVEARSGSGECGLLPGTVRGGRHGSGVANVVCEWAVFPLVFPLTQWRAGQVRIVLWLWTSL